MIVVAALLTVAAPFFSQQAGRSHTEFKEAIALTVRLAAFLTLPIAVSMSMLRHPLIAVLFERGTFTNEHTLGTATVLLGFMASLLFYALTFILDRGLCVVGATAVLMKLAVMAFVVKIVCAWGMAQLWGLLGLSLSTVPALAFQSVGMYVALTRNVGMFDLGLLKISLGKMLLSSATMALLILGVLYESSFVLGSVHAKLSSSVLLVSAIAIGGVGYWVMAICMKSAEAAALLGIFGNRGLAKER
jgi:putative peptidoglycan lipid II flippase